MWGIEVKRRSPSLREADASRSHSIAIFDSLPSCLVDVVAMNLTDHDGVDFGVELAIAVQPVTERDGEA